jgi:branched-chain amino acid transport system permease protein
LSSARDRGRRVILGHPSSFWLGLILNGIAIAGVYALFGAGLTMIFGAARIMNFAQGDVFMIGGYACFFCMTSLHLSYWLSLPLVALGLGLVGLVGSQTIFRRITASDRSLEIGIVMTLGLSLVLEEGALKLLGAQQRTPTWSMIYSTITVGGVTIQTLRAVALVLAVVILAALGWFLRFTRAGLAIRAIPQNRALASVMGIQQQRINAFAIGIGCALSGLAGATVAPYYGAYPTMGASFVFIGFAILFMGGSTSVLGTIVAAVLVGVTTSLLAGAVSSAAAAMAPLAVMALVLLVRPNGLFGARLRLS